MLKNREGFYKEIVDCDEIPMLLEMRWYHFNALERLLDQKQIERPQSKILGLMHSLIRLFKSHC